MQKKWLRVGVMLMLAALLPTTAAAASTVVFLESFKEALPGNFSGVTTTEGVQGFAGYGFSDNFLRNTSAGNPAAATILTLSGLPAHTSIDINFLFAAIDSWDGLATSYGPDYFTVMVDGAPVFQEAFPNATMAPLNLPADLGFNSDWFDRAYALGLKNIAHTASNLTIKFFASGAGWQGGYDESWAMDNLEVRVNAVTTPLPGSVILVGSALLGLGVWRRRS